MTKFRFKDRFEKEFGKIKVKDLLGDLRRWEKAFEARKTRLTGIEGPIPRLEKKGVKIPIYKVKKFRCKELNKGSRSGIRIVFAYDAEADEVLYLQIYVKNKKENHDEKYIVQTLKGLDKLP